METKEFFEFLENMVKDCDKDGPCYFDDNETYVIVDCVLDKESVKEFLERRNKKE